MKNELIAFEYLKLSDNIVCRYPLGPDNQTYHIIGEVYENKNEEWVRRVSTMKYKMSGEGTVISEQQAIDLINKFQLKK